MGDAIVADPATGAGERRLEQENAALRTRFLADVPCLTAMDLHRMGGHRVQAFSVPARGRELYPAFQFADGRPRPIIAEILETLPNGMTPWQVAFWFVAGNGWLGGASPAESLDDRKAVLAAAARERRDVIG